MISLNSTDTIQSEPATKSVGTNRGLPFKATAVPGTDGKLLVFQYRDAAQFGIELMEFMIGFPRELQAEAQKQNDIYQAWPYGNDPVSSSTEQDATPWFADHGLPLPRPSDEVKEEFNNRNAEVYPKALRIGWHDLFTLQSIHEQQKAYPYEVNDLIASYPNEITEATLLEIAKEANGYLTALKEEYGNEHARHDKATNAYRWLTWDMAHEQKRAAGLRESTRETMGQILAEWNVPDKLIYVAVEDLDKTIAARADSYGSSPPTAKLLELEACFEHLSYAALGTLAHTYDVGAVILKTAPNGDQSYLDGVQQRLSQYPDTKDILDMAKGFDVAWVVKKIPAYFADDYNNGLIGGTIAFYDRKTKTIMAIQPPDNADEFIHPIECDSYFAHELRHAGRHFNNPEVYIPDDEVNLVGADALQHLSNNLYHLKMIEADAKTNEIWFVYQELTENGVRPIDESKTKGLNVFETLRYLAILDREISANKDQAGYAEACKRGLSEVFFAALQDQRPYENRPENAYLIGSMEFPELWENTVKARDKQWVSRLTAMKSLGDKPYLQDNDDAVQTKLETALLHTIPGSHNNPGKTVRVVSAMDLNL